MNNKIKIAVLSFIVVMISIPRQASAQSYDIAPAMGSNVFLLHEMNPGAMMDGNYFVLPFFGNFSVGASVPTTLNKALYTKGGENFVNTGNVAKAMNDNLTNVAFNMDILNMGFRFGDKHMVSFGLRAKVLGDISFPGDAVSFVISNPMTSMNSYNLNLGTNMTGYGEAALAYAIEPIKNLSVGVRVKYIAGLVNLNSNSTAKLMLQDDMTYNIQGDIDIRSSGYDFSESEFKDALGIKVNNGFGVDLGAEYKFDFGLRVGASVTDLGMISWKNANNSCIKSDPDQIYHFQGVTNFDSVVKKGDEEKLLDQLWDDMKTSMGLEPISGRRYKTSLSPKMNIYGFYSIDKAKRHSVSLNMITKFNQPKAVKNDFSFTAGYTYSNKNDRFRAVAAYTYGTRYGSKLAAGVLAQGPSSQFYFMINAIPVLGIDATRNVGFNMGVNFFIGKKGTDKGPRYRATTETVEYQRIAE